MILAGMDPVLQMRGITKRFPGVLALDDVDFDLRKGEVHAILGENGAGKSTLIKILSGAYSLEDGEVYLRGNRIFIQNPKHALELGISVIYQEFNLVPTLTVSENIFLAREPMTVGKLIDSRNLTSNAQAILDDLRIELNPETRVDELGVAMQQMVEVAKALSMDAEIIIMDEPTASLGESEIVELFATIRHLKEKGVSIIYISHRLQELPSIADRVTVLRDGKKIATCEVAETDLNELIRLMVGRRLSEQFPKVAVPIGPEVLRVEGLTWGKKLKDISFSLYRGEVLGFAGLVGSGRTELMRCLFGAQEYDKGKIYLDGSQVRFKSPRDAVKAGIGLITEDRKKQGLFLGLSVTENITITDLDQVVSGVFIDYSREKAVGLDYVQSLRIKTPALEHLVRYLSGGNQQKVALAKWLFSNARILIFDEPTRGIDVGAKIEVYNLMNELVEAGVGVIMVSSELPEIIGMSDRILVMGNGRLTGEFLRSDATQDKIVECATKG